MQEYDCCDLSREYMNVNVGLPSGDGDGDGNITMGKE